MKRKRKALGFILSVVLTGILAAPVYGQVWTLQQCIDTAQIHSKNLQISKNNVALSVEKQKEAQSNLIPKVKFSGDYKYFFDQPTQLMPQSAFGGPEGVYKEVQFGTPHNFNLSLQAAVPLYNPQVYGAMKTTKAATELNKLKLKKTREAVYFNVSNLYYNAQILKHQLAFIDSNLVNTTRLLHTVTLLYQQKLAKKTDVEKIKLQKEQLQTRRKTVEDNLSQVLNLLKFTMGIPIQQPVDVSPDIAYQPDIQYPHNVVVDIQIANMRKDLLNTELKTLKHSRIPSLSLYGGYSEIGFGYDKKPNDFLKFYPTSLAGIQLTVPLFNGMVTKRKINQKKIEIKNTDLQKHLLTEQNNMEIENAKRLREAALETIRNTSSQIKLAQSVYAQTVLQQKQGMASLTDVLMADNALQEAQQSYLAAIVNYLKADLTLKKLTGNIEQLTKK